MALRLRKDVQKASYYVWFLGAEEARGLRGPRVLLPAIGHLLERSREIEPLKVTLQVSHKGMKIVQGSSKHFITHSAITCSIQTDDIVACVLLLYNPTTKCPLHVHAYRCDSETTAQGLNQLLQVLINRPENQKRFSELESRLGLVSSPISAIPTSPQSPSSSIPPNIVQKHKSTQQLPLTSATKSMPLKTNKSKQHLTESSLGSSDTGTSTRESECSEEHMPPISPLSPLKASIFDSLAAELREKLNGNGPPLLLPPRDYDTVHRSKGNLAATELRRCRNQLIVGGQTVTTGIGGDSGVGGVGGGGGGGGGTGSGNSGPPITKKVVSSRGSSGIGSDLAPSPERHDLHSSSDDEWIQQKNQNNEQVSKEPLKRTTAGIRQIITGKDHQQKTVQQLKTQLQQQQQQYLNNEYNDSDNSGPPSYLYPKEPFKQKYGVPTPLLITSAHSQSQPMTKQKQYSQPPQQQIPSPQQRSTIHHRDEDRIVHPPQYARKSREDEEAIKPVITRPRTFDARFKEVLLEDHPIIDSVLPISSSKQYNNNINNDNNRLVDKHDKRYGQSQQLPINAYRQSNEIVSNEQRSTRQQSQQRQRESINDNNPDSRISDEFYYRKQNPINSDKYNNQNKRLSKYYDDDYLDGDNINNNHQSNEHMIEKEMIADRYRENLTDKQKQKMSQHNRYGIENPHIDPPTDNYPSSRYTDNIRHSVDRNVYPTDDDDDHQQLTISPPAIPSKDKSKVYRHHSTDTDNIIRSTYDQYPVDLKSKIIPTPSQKQQLSPAPPQLHPAPHNHHRNPYKEPESLPYLESMEKMIKSPVMRYKSFDDNNFSDSDQFDGKKYPSTKYHQHELPVDRDYNKYNEKMVQRFIPTGVAAAAATTTAGHHDPKDHDDLRRSRSYHPSPIIDEGVMKIAQKDRFQDAKDKFKAIDRTFVEQKLHPRRQFTDQHGGYGNNQNNNQMSDESSASSPHYNRHHPHQQHRPQSQHLTSSSTHATTPTPAVQPGIGGHGSRPYNYTDHTYSSDEDDTIDSYQQQQQQHHPRRNINSGGDRAIQQQQQLHHQQQQQQQQPIPMRSSSNSREMSYNSRGVIGKPTPQNHGMGMNERYSVNLDHSPERRITSSKSIGNLVKGYRHSYAEPRNPAPMPPRSSGRVGLAAVNPY